MFGMSLLWLTFCNIFVGIYIAFVVLGAGPVRSATPWTPHVSGIAGPPL